MPRREIGPGKRSIELCERIAYEMKRRNLPRKVVAGRAGMTPDQLTKVLDPAKYKGKLTVDMAERLAKAINRNLNWLVGAQINTPQTAGFPSLWRVGEPTSRLMEVINQHEKEAKTGSAIYTTFPLRLVTPELLALMRENIASIFVGQRLKVAETVSDLARIAVEDHARRPANENYRRRRTFMRASDVRRLIAGQDEFQGRTPTMAFAFFANLRQHHVLERGYRIMFIEDERIPPLAGRHLRKYTGITLVGNGLSLRRDANYDIEIITSRTPDRLQEDIQLMSELEAAVTHPKTPRGICDRIRRFEEELKEWLGMHPNHKE
jgi:hypothetical protein